MIRSGGERRLQRLRRGSAEINVVPFVDIVLVLLVIFMVGAPLASQGVSVQLPKTAPSNLALASTGPLVITVTADGFYSLMASGGPKQRTLEQITRHIQVLVRRGTAPAVVIRADARSDYGRIAELLAQVRFSGVERVGLITEVVEAVAESR